MKFIKKISAAVSAVAVTAAGLCSALPASVMTGISASAATGIYGDANNDGKFDIRDAAFIANRLANNNAGAISSSADCTGDKTVNIRDAAATASRLSSDYQIKRIVELVNQERVKKGVSPLVLDERLTGAAMVRAKEIVNNFSHTRPNGAHCKTVLDDFNMNWSVMGENIAAGSASADEIMHLWVDSEGHYENIVDTEYAKIGIGYCYAPNSTYGYYWTQVFVQ